MNLAGGSHDYSWGISASILKVDLTKGTIRKEPLPSGAVLRKFVGGMGLGLYYLLKEAPMDVAATDPRSAHVHDRASGGHPCAKLRQLGHNLLPLKHPLRGGGWATGTGFGPPI